MNTLLSSVVLALCTLVAVSGALAAPVNEPVPDTNFSSTCSGISVNLGNLDLTATCQNSSGGTETTTIGLNSCVGNTNGELTAGNSFSGSCEDISFSGVELSALCRNPAGTLISTSLDLNAIFSNTNGVLTCP
ncbi:Cyanovirin-N [Mycena epipterygia]|nr:Cyanovirin-N [Mycena epipterygia]